MHNPSQSTTTPLASIAPLLRLRKVLELTGLGRSTVYRMMSERSFPTPVRLGKRAVAWRHEDVQQWTQSRQPMPELPRVARADFMGLLGTS
jgi:prophage regulatory protein